MSVQELHGKVEMTNTHVTLQPRTSQMYMDRYQLTLHCTLSLCSASIILRLPLPLPRPSSLGPAAPPPPAAAAAASPPSISGSSSAPMVSASTSSEDEPTTRSSDESSRYSDCEWGGER